MINNHTHLLNFLIAKHSLKSYLEIGVQNPANNLYKIATNIKIGVDPEIEVLGYVHKMSSDEYFKRFNLKYDLVFIDGYHSADQVKRDFENSLRCLNDGGYILIHDTLPEEEITTCVPRGAQKIWHGDVYKFAMNLPCYRRIEFCTINMDNGCTVVWKAKQPPVFRKGINVNVNWNIYLKERQERMNIVQPANIEKYL